jgi:acyl carrier protein
MDKTELTDAIRNIIHDVADIDPAQIKGDTHFVKDLGMDSLMGLEVVALIERRYSIKISEDDLMQILTLDKAIEIAIQYIGKEKAGDSATSPNKIHEVQ